MTSDSREHPHRPSVRSPKERERTDVPETIVRKKRPEDQQPSSRAYLRRADDADDSRTFTLVDLPDDCADVLNERGVCAGEICSAVIPGMAEWLARRDRSRQIRAELAARRAAGKQRGHAERLANKTAGQRPKPAESDSKGLKGLSEGNGMPPTALACDGTSKAPAR